ncbi:MAG: hypothetical protein VW452_01120 [Pelagibacteraceae bacterium]
MATLDFSSFIWSFFFDNLFFNEILTSNILIGGTIVLLSVGYIFYRERVLKKRIVLGVNKQF